MIRLINADGVAANVDEAAAKRLLESGGWKKAPAKSVADKSRGAAK